MKKAEVKKAQTEEEEEKGVKEDKGVNEDEDWEGEGEAT